jgi:hypothetical protein
MRSSGMLLAIPAIVMLCLTASPPVLGQPKPGEQGDAKQPTTVPATPPTPAPATGAPAGKNPIGKFSIVTQSWHRFPGLAVADITFQNANDFRVRNAVVSCEFFDAKGKLIAARGSTVFQSFPPGKKKVEGIEFSLREKNAVPGSCRVISVSTAAESD